MFLPHIIELKVALKSSLMMIISEMCLVVAQPEPIAIPISALVIPSLSLIPSPVISTYLSIY